jgi:enamine deaminase RidA (YjgF/YER057c/UK114 family)
MYSQYSNGAEVAVKRTAVNPVTWSVEMGFNQGEIVSGHTRTLYCSGQTAMSGEGKPQHDGDMAAQLALSLDNLEAVLGEAGMSLANLVRLNVYTTDVDLLFPHYGVLASRLGTAGGTGHHDARGDTAGDPRPDGRARGDRRRVMRPRRLCCLVARPTIRRNRPMPHRPTEIDTI